MRPSTYFAEIGEVFVFNMGDELMQEIIHGDYLIVYVQSIGGRRPPNEIHPTSERMVRILPVGGNGGASASGPQSFIRFNNHFRNIRDLVFYPTRKNERVTLDNLKGPSPQIASPEDANKSPMAAEAGVRMATGDRSCTIFNDFDVDPLPLAHDDRMEHLFAHTDNIRQRGSVISFGMVVNDDKKTGYEFCQLEFAAAEGDRILIVAIKIPDEKKKFSSLKLKKQILNVDLEELVIQNFIGVDKGFFAIKEYGKQDGDETSAPLGPKSHEFYNLDLEKSMEKDLFENYSHEVGRVCLEANQFNAGLFEEWREMIPSQTMDEHLKNIYELYTQEALSIVEQLKTPPMDGSDGGHQDLTALTGGNDQLRRKLHIVRDAQTYVMSRRKDLEFERVQEYNFGKKIGPGLPRPRRTTTVIRRPTGGYMAPRPHIPDLSYSSGSTTPRARTPTQGHIRGNMTNVTPRPRAPPLSYSSSHMGGDTTNVRPRPRTPPQSYSSGNMTNTTPRPHTPALSYSSGSTTPTNSPVRRAQMVKLDKGKGKEVLATGNETLKEILERLMKNPSFIRMKDKPKGKYTAGELVRLRRQAEENMWNIKIPSLGRSLVSDSGRGGMLHLTVDRSHSLGRSLVPDSGGSGLLHLTVDRSHSLGRSLVPDSRGGGLLHPTVGHPLGRNRVSDSGGGGILQPTVDDHRGRRNRVSDSGGGGLLSPTVGHPLRRNRVSDYSSSGIIHPTVDDRPWRRNRVSDSGGGGLLRPSVGHSVGRNLVSDSGGGGLVRPNAGAGRNAGAEEGAKAGARANTSARPGSRVHLTVEYDADTQTGANSRADAGGDARTNTVAGSNAAANADAGGKGAQAGARFNIGPQTGSKAHVAVKYDADTQTGADTRVDAGGDARANTVAGSSVAANTLATMDTGATVGANTGTALNTDNDEDWESSDDDEEGGVSLTPEPVNTKQELPPLATLSKPRTLDGQSDSVSSRSTQESMARKRSQRPLSSDEDSPVKRSQNGGGGVSIRSVSTEDNSSSNDDRKIESGGGTPDKAPSPKKRKLSDDNHAAPGGGRSDITKLT
ncbi:hypothetical protein V499_01352 [Pseudogymnoascus sp. VKM F-103]|nr:hypothetical protein V499_01352 [Pseudogymnoascus sp. VKM F-103]